jgi:hypothetical protein
MSLACGLFLRPRGGMRDQNRQQGKANQQRGHFPILGPGLFAMSMPRRYDLRVTADSVLLAATRTCSGWDASVKPSSSVIA